MSATTERVETVRERQDRIIAELLASAQRAKSRLYQFPTTAPTSLVPAAPTREAATPRPKLNAVTAAVGAAIFHEDQPAPEFVVPGALPLEIGVLQGAGGTGKTTVLLHLAAHIVLGRPWHGHSVAMPGKVLFLSAEDGIKRVRYRLHRAARDMQLTGDEIEKLGAGLMVEDLTGQNARVVESDRAGNLSHTPFVDHIVDSYRNRGLSLLIIDPAAFFGPGERFVNDGEAQLVQACAKLRRELGCAVMVLHHVGKANARAGASDQYAGRGGSALADGMRFVWTMVTHKANGDGVTAPPGVPPEAMAANRLMRLHVVKLTDAELPTEPLWILRTGFKFERLEPLGQVSDPRLADLGKVIEFLRKELAQGATHSKNTLETATKAVGLGRNDIRAAFDYGVEAGLLRMVDLPPEKRKGGRKDYVAVVDQQPSDEVTTTGGES